MAKEQTVNVSVSSYAAGFAAGQQHEDHKLAGLTVGSPVHYVLANGECRGAIVCRVWPNGVVNLRVFHDGANDCAPKDEIDDRFGSAINSLEWVTSVHYDETHAPRTWHHNLPTEQPTRSPIEARCRQ